MPSHLSFPYFLPLLFFLFLYFFFPWNLSPYPQPTNHHQWAIVGQSSSTSCHRRCHFRQPRTISFFLIFFFPFSHSLYFIFSIYFIFVPKKLHNPHRRCSTTNQSPPTSHYRRRDVDAIFGALSPLSISLILVYFIFNFLIYFLPSIHCRFFSSSHPWSPKNCVGLFYALFYFILIVIVVCDIWILGLIWNLSFVN